MLVRLMKSHPRYAVSQGLEVSAFDESCPSRKCFDLRVEMKVNFQTGQPYRDCRCTGCHTGCPPDLAIFDGDAHKKPRYRKYQFRPPWWGKGSTRHPLVFWFTPDTLAELDAACRPPAPCSFRS